MSRSAQRASTRGAWARAHGIALTPLSPEVVAGDAGLLRALADGVKRGGGSPVEALPEAEEWYAIREQGRTVGVIALRRDHPRRGAATLLAVAIAPEQRGRAAGTKALLAAERKLRGEGYAPLFARVPRTNGRGLYFMLRCGFIPVSERPEDPGDTTWFARAGAT